MLVWSRFFPGGNLQDVSRWLRAPLHLPLQASGSALVCILLSSVLTAAQTQTAASRCPPTTHTDNVRDRYGTTLVADPYRWLEEQNSPETRAWIEAQNKCTHAALSDLPGRNETTKRLTELYHTDTYSLPIEYGGRYFFSKRAAGEDLARIYVRKGKTGADQLLIDPLPWSKDHSASALIEDVSHDGKLLLYGRREGGQDEVTVHVLDVSTGRDLPDVLPRATYFSVLCTPDNRGVYYSRANPDGPRAYYHAMGTDPAEDRVMYGRGLGKDRIVGLLLSDDGQYLVYIVVHGSGSEQTEVYLQDVKHDGPVITVVNNIRSLFHPSFGGHTLYIDTNWKAPRWHVYATDVASPSQDHWREVIPEGRDSLSDFVAVGGKLVVDYLHDAASEIAVFDADGKNRKPLPLPTLGSVGVSGRWGSSEFFYAFASYSYPTTNFVYDLSTSRSSIWSKPSTSIDPAAFETEQVWYRSKDGTPISMFLFHKKGLQLDGNNPTVLYGYGGFDISMTPAYSPSMLAWTERGGIYAVANLRGGGEYGEEWHRAGMLGEKQNVFDDFIAAAQFLIEKKYTNPSRLAIVGGSNGGLLVGAVLTQRPELFRALICQYPLLDMLRYQKFMDGPYWVSEYGSSDNPDQFGYIYKYSPYQNVKRGGPYPSVLFITGDGDTRVAPLHARKMTALLQADTGSGRPIFLLYDTKSGHSGGRPISKIIEEQTDILSYLFWQLAVPNQ